VNLFQPGLTLVGRQRRRFRDAHEPLAIIGDPPRSRQLLLTADQRDGVRNHGLLLKQFRQARGEKGAFLGGKGVDFHASSLRHARNPAHGAP